MSNADVRMDYDAMADLIREADNMARTLEYMVRSAEEVAKKIEGGGLVNRNGKMWVDQIRSRIEPYLRQQQERYEELVRDLDGAVRDLRDGDVTARNRFSG